MISVVIPTLNAGDSLARCLASLEDGRKTGLLDEVVIADGGSTDETVQIAQSNECKVVTAPRGRGSQLAAGVDQTSGEFLLILHADTVLGEGWRREVQQFIEGEDAPRKFGVLRFALDDPTPSARRIEWLVAWRASALALPYGDQGLVVHRSLYEAAGGFADIPLMEDVDLIRRIKRITGRQGLHRFSSPAVTSAARYKEGGYLLRPVRNLTCLSLYFLGLPPRLLVKLYG